MNKKIYRQYDSRWGSKNYPVKGSSFSGNGCGACAVLHCIIERDKYKNYTPNNIISYMKKYAVKGQGTLHSGIPAGLKHYGMTNVKEHATMSALWKELEKGGRVGVILFSAGKGPDDTLWTSGGHYIAFTDYKVKNGKHYLYMKDSGTRKHDGWYAYENSMKGRCYKVWSCKVPAEPKKKYIGHITKTGMHKSEFTYSSSNTSSRHWTYVTRAKNATKREKIAKAMESAIAKKKYIGYSNSGSKQFNLYDFLNKKGFDFKNLKSKHYANCSVMASICARCAGLKTPRKSSSENIHKTWDTKGFEVIKYKKGMKLLRGDVLTATKPAHHTVIYLGVK